MIREAVSLGAQIIQIQELFESPYFCIEQNAKHFDLATTLEDSENDQTVSQAGGIAQRRPTRELVRACRPRVLQLRRRNRRRWIRAGVYRKVTFQTTWGTRKSSTSHPAIQDFRSGRPDTHPLASGICWDQWYPEAARAMALQGCGNCSSIRARSVPTQFTGPIPRALGSASCRDMPVANCMPVIACNRIGTEKATTSDLELTFFGSSFIADQLGVKVQEADSTSETVLVHTFDLEACRRTREYWPLFRDRRPDLYECLLTLDGRLTTRAPYSSPGPNRPMTPAS